MVCGAAGHVTDLRWDARGCHLARLGRIGCCLGLVCALTLVVATRIVHVAAAAPVSGLLWMRGITCSIA